MVETVGRRRQRKNGKKNKREEEEKKNEPLDLISWCILVKKYNY